MKIKEKFSALIISDPHLYGKNPLCRKDNLIDVQFKKLTEVKDLANKYDVPLIILGDLTDSPHISHSMVSIIAQILNDVEQGVFVVVGNHDLWYYDLSSLDSTALGALCNASNNIHLIDYLETALYKWSFDFAHWGQDIQNNSGSILLTHKAVVPKEFIQKYLWLSKQYGNDKFYVLEELPKKYDLILCGDWHFRYIYKNKRTLLINPGALTRRTASEDNFKTFPSAILVNFSSYNYKIIPLENARPAEEVISREHLTINEIKKEIAENVNESIRKIKFQKESDKSKYLSFMIKTLFNSSFTDETIKLIKDILTKILGEKIKFENIKFKLRRN